MIGNGSDGNIPLNIHNIQNCSSSQIDDIKELIGTLKNDDLKWIIRAEVLQKMGDIMNVDKMIPIQLLMEILSLLLNNITRQKNPNVLRSVIYCVAVIDRAFSLAVANSMITNPGTSLWTANTPTISNSNSSYQLNTNSNGVSNMNIISHGSSLAGGGIVWRSLLLELFHLMRVNSKVVSDDAKAALRSMHHLNPHPHFIKAHIPCVSLSQLMGLYSDIITGPRGKGSNSASNSVRVLQWLEETTQAELTNLIDTTLENTLSILNSTTSMVYSSAVDEEDSHKSNIQYERADVVFLFQKSLSMLQHREETTRSSAVNLVALLIIFDIIQRLIYEQLVLYSDTKTFLFSETVRKYMKVMMIVNGNDDDMIGGPRKGSISSLDMKSSVESFHMINSSLTGTNTMITSNKGIETKSSLIKDDLMKFSSPNIITAIDELEKSSPRVYEKLMTLASQSLGHHLKLLLPLLDKYSVTLIESNEEENPNNELNASLKSENDMIPFEHANSLPSPPTKSPSTISARSTSKFFGMLCVDRLIGNRRCPSVDFFLTYHAMTL
jgi:hypothetical protein